MALKLNTTTIDNVIFKNAVNPNGITLCKLIYNNTLVFENHDYAAWNITKSATCGTTGLKKCQCQRVDCNNIRCSETKTEVIPATGNHTYSDRSNAWGRCSVCYKVHVNHEHIISGGECNYCSYEYAETKVASSFDNTGDGVAESYPFAQALPERFNAQEAIHIDAVLDITDDQGVYQEPGMDSHYIRYDEYDGTSNTMPYAHVYCLDGTDDYLYYSFEVPESGIYEMAAHLRIKDKQLRGATYIINKGTSNEHAFVTTYGWNTDEAAYAVRNNDFLKGSYMTGILVYLQAGINTIHITSAVDVTKNQHFRDLYFVKKAALCNHDFYTGDTTYACKYCYTKFGLTMDEAEAIGVKLAQGAKLPDYYYITVTFNNGAPRYSDGFCRVITANGHKMSIYVKPATGKALPGNGSTVTLRGKIGCVNSVENGTIGQEARIFDATVIGEAVYNINGIWEFNNYLSGNNASNSAINFISNGVSYGGIKYVSGNDGGLQYYNMQHARWDTACLKGYSGITTWMNDSYKRIIFNEEYSVSQSFYEWLTLNAHQHTYGITEYTWSNNYNSCQATRTCTYDSCGAQVIAFGNITTVDYRAATCTSDGYKINKATFNNTSWAQPQITDVITIPGGHKMLDATCTEPKTCSACGYTEGTALGHSYGSATYNWSTDTGDNKTCTATRTCSKCNNTQTANGHVIHSITTDPTTTTNGTRTYRATFSEVWAFSRTMTDKTLKNPDAAGVGMPGQNSAGDWLYYISAENPNEVPVRCYVSVYDSYGSCTYSGDFDIAANDDLSVTVVVGSSPLEQNGSYTMYFESLSDKYSDGATITGYVS